MEVKGISRVGLVGLGEIRWS